MSWLLFALGLALGGFYLLAPRRQPALASGTSETLEKSSRLPWLLVLIGALLGTLLFSFFPRGQAPAADSLFVLRRQAEQTATAPAWLGYASSALQEQNLEQSIYGYGRALQLDPQNPQAFMGLGGSLILAGLPQEAEQALMRAVGLAPNAPEPWALIGHARSARGDNQGAIAAWQKALELGATPREEIESWIESARNPAQTNP